MGLLSAIPGLAMAGAGALMGNPALIAAGVGALQGGLQGGLGSAGLGGLTGFAGSEAGQDLMQRMKLPSLGSQSPAALQQATPNTQLSVANPTTPGMMQRVMQRQVPQGLFSGGFPGNAINMPTQASSGETSEILMRLALMRRNLLNQAKSVVGDNVSSLTPFVQPNSMLFNALQNPRRGFMTRELF